MIRVINASTKNHWSLVKAIYMLLPWPLLARILNMTIGIFFGGSHVYLLESFVEQVNPLIIAFGALPGYFFFSAYILLVLFWAILYYRSRDQNTTFIKRVQRGYLIVNVFVYIILIVFLVLIFVFSTPIIVTIIHPLEALYSGILSLLAALVFCIYGRRVYRELGRLPIISQRRALMTRKIGFLTLVCTIAFGLRSIITFASLVMLWTPLKGNADLLFSVITRLLLFLGCELIPTYVLIALLKKPVNQAGETAQLLNWFCGCTWHLTLEENFGWW